MKNKFILFEQKDNYGFLYFNRVENLNALSTEMIDEAQEVLHELNQKKDLRVLILTGKGKTFISGADINEMKNHSAESIVKFAQNGQKLCTQIEQMNAVTIAAINGFCLGGGFEIALSCDLRFASSKARLGLPETSLGLIPGFGGSQRLARMIGSGLAMEMVFAASLISAKIAKEYKLVNDVSSPDELIKSVEKLTLKILKNGPNAVMAAKKVIRQGMDLSLEDSQKLEAKYFHWIYSQDEADIGQAAALEKRRPVYKQILNDLP